MQQLHVYRTLKDQYRDGWSYMNPTEFVGTVKLTPARKQREGNGFDDGGTFRQHCTIPTGVNRELLIQGLRDTMSGSRCKHEYDCCGCSLRHTRVKKLGARQLLLITSINYNY